MPRAQPPGLPSLTVSENLTRIREAKGYSARAFLAVLNDHGIDLKYSGYTALEKGVTRVTVDVLIAAATALDVSPAELLMPSGDDPAAPSGYGTANRAYTWDWLRACSSLDGHESPAAQDRWTLDTWPHWSRADYPGPNPYRPTAGTYPAPAEAVDDDTVADDADTVDDADEVAS